MSSWSQLPHDLLVVVVEHIQKLEDFISFRAVCKGWFAVGKKEYFKGLWLWQEIPYMLLPARDDSDDAREFYSLVESEIVASLRIPKFKGRMCHASLGWSLAVENDGTMCLLDPFSSVEIPLPHQNTFPEYEFQAQDAYIFVRKIVLSARPSEASDFILLIISDSGDGQIGFWRPGDESWNKIEFWDCAYSDVMYYGGHFYAIDRYGYAYVFTLEGHNTTKHQRVTHLEIVDVKNFHAKNIDDRAWSDTLYILKTSESLLMISRTAPWWNGSKRSVYYNTSQFRIYEVNMSIGTWTKINNVGSMAIFVGNNTTFAIDTSSLFGKIKSNHIYFSDDGWEYYHFASEEEGGGKDMGAYNIETGTIESFYSVEMLLSKVCPSIWITPSF